MGQEKLAWDRTHGAAGAGGGSDDGEEVAARTNSVSCHFFSGSTCRCVPNAPTSSVAKPAMALVLPAPADPADALAQLGAEGIETPTSGALPSTQMSLSTTSQQC